MTITGIPAASFIQNLRSAATTDWISAPFNAARTTIHQNKSTIALCAGTAATSLIPLGLTTLVVLGMAEKIEMPNDAIDILILADLFSLFLVIKIYDCLKQSDCNANNNGATEDSSTENNEVWLELGANQRLSASGVPLPLYTPIPEPHTQRAPSPPPAYS